MVEGNSLRSISRMTGVSLVTILKLLADLGTVCVEAHQSLVRNVRAQRVQVDEIWNFCYAKAKNVPEEKKIRGAGDVWTWVGIDADTKLIISYLVGGRDALWAWQFMQDLASRVTTRIQLTSDGLRYYVEAVQGAFGMGVDFAQLVKIYGPRQMFLRLATVRRSALDAKPKPLLGTLIQLTSQPVLSSARI